MSEASNKSAYVGAHVNDSGGPGCGKTTPLHDVCLNACAKHDFKDSHTHVQKCVDIIQMLVKSQANVHAKDDKVSCDAILVALFVNGILIGNYVKKTLMLF